MPPRENQLPRKKKNRLTSDDEGALERYYDQIYSTPESSPNTDEAEQITSAPQREPAAEGEPATAEEITRKKTTIPCVPQSEPAAKIQPTAEGEPATVQQDEKEEDERKPKVHVKSFPVFPQPTTDRPLCSQPVVRLSNHLIQRHSISTKEYRQKVLYQSRAMKCKEPKPQEG
ncbi:uncharacterized protein [Apostichopus japonicus]|uniref:uncharacterized protein isoform X7 n=1 Tax=Stichopus japonicus TaxID=307972 RepID=UPI003AB7F312